MRKQNGITMITLIITIIVMVILAGVSISAVVGDDNVILRAKKTVADTEKAKIDEEVKEAWGNAVIEYWEYSSEVDKEEYFQNNVAAINKFLKTGQLTSFNYDPNGTSIAIFVPNDNPDKEYQIEIETKQE